MQLNTAHDKSASTIPDRSTWKPRLSPYRNCTTSYKFSEDCNNFGLTLFLAYQWWFSAVI